MLYSITKMNESNQSIGGGAKETGERTSKPREREEGKCEYHWEQGTEI